MQQSRQCSAVHQLADFSPPSVRSGDSIIIKQSLTWLLPAHHPACLPACSYDPHANAFNRQWRPTFTFDPADRRVGEGHRLAGCRLVSWQQSLPVQAKISAQGLQPPAQNAQQLRMHLVLLNSRQATSNQQLRPCGVLCARLPACLTD
jgi:hypothetical protein